MFTEHDLQQIKDHSLSVEQIERQLDAFKKGFPFLKLSAAATCRHRVRQVECLRIFSPSLMVTGMSQPTAL